MPSHPSQPRPPKEPGTSAEKSTPLRSLRQLQGQTFHGHYELEEVLGEGAMGVVFRARHTAMNRQVALKLMKLESIQKEEEALDRFRAEIEMVANLSHPNIVRIFDSGFEPELGLYYVSMELIDGPSLSDLLLRHSLRPALALEIVNQICRGLTEPHSLNIVHRDIKPENTALRLRSDGALEVKILDFGIARALRTDIRLTQTGIVMGTPAYMAPELSLNEPIDARTDLYALGIMLYEMLTGTLPFKDGSPLQVILKHLQEPLPRLTAHPGKTPAGLQHLLDHLTAREPAARIASALHVCSTIQALRQDDPSLSLTQLDPLLPLEHALSPWLLPLSPPSNAVLTTASVDTSGSMPPQDHSTRSALSHIETAPTPHGRASLKQVAALVTVAAALALAIVLVALLWPSSEATVLAPPPQAAPVVEAPAPPPPKLAPPESPTPAEPTEDATAVATPPPPPPGQRGRQGGGQGHSSTPKAHGAHQASQAPRSPKGRPCAVEETQTPRQTRPERQTGLA